jgi:hypothetical protein
VAADFGQRHVLTQQHTRAGEPDPSIRTSQRQAFANRDVFLVEIEDPEGTGSALSLRTIYGRVGMD